MLSIGKNLPNAKDISEYFDMERKRQNVATDKKLGSLRKLYSSKSPELENPNSALFWNEHFTKYGNHKEEYMAQDRENIIYRSLKKKEGRLLNVGFGRGYLDHLLVKNNRLELFGIDISTTALRNIKKSIKNGVYVRGSIFSIPFPDRWFDYVIVSEVLEHISPARNFQALKEVYRVLKKGGLIIVTVPLNEGLEQKVSTGENHSGHMRDYTPDLVMAELKIRGFNIRRFLYLYAFDKMYRFKKFLNRFLLIHRWDPNNVIIFATK